MPIKPRPHQLILPTSAPTRREMLAGLGLASCLVGGCSRFDASTWFSRGRYDVDRRFRESIDELECPIPPQLRDESQWSALVIGDMHFWENECNTSLIEVGDYLVHHPVDFLIQLGDLVDAGYPGEYRTGIEMLDAFDLPYYSCLGNHDVWNSGWTEYKYYCGPSVYELRVGEVLFIALDLAGGTLGGLQRPWLEERLENSTSEHIILMSHYPLWAPTTVGFSEIASEQEIYDILDLMRHYEVDAHLSGHTHRWAHTDFHNSELYTVGSMKEAHPDRCGLRIELSEGILSYRRVPFPFGEEDA